MPFVNRLGRQYKLALMFLQVICTRVSCQINVVHTIFRREESRKIMYCIFLSGVVCMTHFCVYGHIGLDLRLVYVCFLTIHVTAEDDISEAVTYLMYGGINSEHLKTEKYLTLYI